MNRTFCSDGLRCLQVLYQGNVCMYGCIYGTGNVCTQRTRGHLHMMALADQFNGPRAERRDEKEWLDSSGSMEMDRKGNGSFSG